MTPDEEPQTAPEPSPAAPAKGPRRSRRGGRRHPRRHGPRVAPPQPAEAVEMTGAPVMAAGEAESAPEPPPQSGPKRPAVSQAIDQVNEVIEELKRALDEMELVLETLELVERQKIDDEREIEALQRALRQLHRPREGGQRRP